MLKSSFLPHNLVLCFSFLHASAMDVSNEEAKKSPAQKEQSVSRDEPRKLLCSCHGYDKGWCDLAFHVSVLTRRAVSKRSNSGMHSKL
jgi:hypothetical protein